MIKPIGATFTMVDGRDEFTVNFLYRDKLPSEVCVIGKGIATRLNNTDRAYKPRVEDAKRAIEDAKRKMVGDPRIGYSAAVRLAARKIARDNDRSLRAYRGDE